MTTRRCAAGALAGAILLAAHAAEAGQATAVRHVGDGVTAPILVRQVPPLYPADAVSAGVHGAVEVEAVIGIDGKVEGPRVTRSLDADRGLDAAALAAVERWEFQPGTTRRAGGSAPVRVLVRLHVDMVPPGQEPQARPLVQPMTVSWPAPPPSAPEAFTQGVYVPGKSGVGVPRLKRQVIPNYNSDAMRSKVQGKVLLEIVIMADGSVGPARVARSLDREHGLDEEALTAARMWLFEPATLNRQPVPVLVTLELEFNIF